MILLGDCIERMAEMDEASVDAIVTDPPYGLEFMGKEWDRLGDGFRRRENPADVERDDPFGRTSRTSPEYQAGLAAQAWHQAWATEALRVLKPGGHLLAFGGTRTYHRLACAIEDAGFEIRDSVIWLYGSGFPKSLDVSKAIDKAAGAERGREEPQRRINPSNAIHPTGFGADGWAPQTRDAATPEAQQWQGWGTALKPAHEPIVVARKPLIGTVAQNIQTHGTGAINVDGCRIGHDEQLTTPQSDPANREGFVGQAMQATGGAERNQAAQAESIERTNNLGRWPANVALSHLPECERVGTRRVKGSHTPGRKPTGGALGSRGVYGTAAGGLENETYADPDGTEQVEAWRCAEGCPVRELDEQSGQLSSGSRKAGDYRRLGGNGRYSEWDEGPMPEIQGDTGGASRFMYVAKASRAERTAGVGVNAHPT